MTKCIIVEDEIKCVNVLQNLIKANFQWISIDVIAVVDTVADAIIEINQLKPDLILMDIELKDGSSFSIFPKLIYHDFQVIFTTAFDNYAINAFKFSALDYLLKPIDNEEFKTALEKFSKTQSTITFKDRIENATDLYHSKSDWKTKKIAIRKNDDIIFESLGNILAFKANGGYTEIFTQDKKKHLTSKNLGFYEGLAGEESSFIRIHHSTIVNIEYIKTLHFPKNSSNAYITLKDDSAYEVSSRKLPQIKAKLKV